MIMEKGFSIEIEMSNFLVSLERTALFMERPNIKFSCSEI